MERRTEHHWLWWQEPLFWLCLGILAGGLAYLAYTAGSERADCEALGGHWVELGRHSWHCIIYNVK